MTRKNYQSHVIRGEGWKNECVGYHIKGNIFDAVKAKSIIEVEGKMLLLQKVTSSSLHKEFNPVRTSSGLCSRTASTM